MSDDEDKDDGMGDDDNDGEAIIEERSFPHVGGVNRLRSCPQMPNLIATWADTGKVHVWDTQPLSFDSTQRGAAQPVPATLEPVHTFSGHADEGFALDWSPVHTGRLASGDCKRFIHVWEPQQGSSIGWKVSSPYRGHTDSVEDLQWSPTESGVFASCSVDRSIRIWDTRTQSKSMLAVEQAHELDVNVISWNRLVRC